MRPCIAVVEDEAPVLQMLCDVLEGDGFVVLAFESPESTGRLPHETQPDLFLIDLMLPGSSGIQLAERLRESGFTETPMIAMSASRVMMQFARGTGLFQDTLYKPFDLTALLSCVTRYVDQVAGNHMPVSNWQ